MDGYKAYKYYLAVKLHFTTKYNVFDSKGSVLYSREKFEARNDKNIFKKLALRFSTDREYIQFVAANFIYGNTDVIYSGAEADDYFVEWNRRKQSITRIFEDDLSKILLSCNKNFTDNYGKGIIDLYLGNKICLETVRIIDDLEPFIDGLKHNNSFMLMFENEIRRVEKSKGFVKYKSEKIVPIYNNFRVEFNEIQNGSHL